MKIGLITIIFFALVFFISSWVVSPVSSGITQCTDQASMNLDKKPVNFTDEEQKCSFARDNVNTTIACIEEVKSKHNSFLVKMESFLTSILRFSSKDDVEIIKEIYNEDCKDYPLNN